MRCSSKVPKTAPGPKPCWRICAVTKLGPLSVLTVIQANSPADVVRSRPGRHLANPETGDQRNGFIAVYWYAYRVVVGAHTVVAERPGGGSGGTATGAAAHGAGIL